MCQCGCTDIQWAGKVVDKEGSAWLFGVYASCQNCSAPAGVQYWRVPKKDWQMYDVKYIPDLPLFDDQTGFLCVISTKAVRKAMVESMVGYEPESGEIDQVDAETLAEEAFPDLRDAVFETEDEVKSQSK